jgi:hypothetical protein
VGNVLRLTNSATEGPLSVDLGDGRIVRVSPIDLDDDDKGDWVIEARPPLRAAANRFERTRAGLDELVIWVQ